MKKLYCFKIQPVNHFKIEKCLKKNKKELDKFFQIDLSLPRIFLINSRNDFNKIRGEKTEPWEVGWADNNIFILHPDKYTQQSNHKNKKGFWKTLKHEHCHLYYKYITHTNKPKWLNEGLCSYLAGQTHNKPSLQEALEVVNLYSVQKSKNIYKIGTFLVEFLIKKFGKRKFSQLLKSLKGIISLRDFKKLFYQIYQIEFNKIGLRKTLKNKIN